MPAPQLTTSDTPISAGFVKVALAIERYVLPWLYAFFAYQRFGAARSHYHAYQLLKRYATVHPVDAVSLSLAFASLSKDVLLFLLMVFTGVTLLVSRAPVALPDKLKHVLVPLAMSYYFFLYGAVDRLPITFRQSLLPPAFQGPAAVGGLILGAVGYSVAIWALFYLGRSFAILVSVRKVVSRGPYAYVRHPIYLGYAIELGGLLLANCSLGMLILGAGFVVFLVARARLEEEKLCEADEGYRSYVNRTGFLLPRFSPSRQANA
jgi:protein-S-isoprenylcysteine O-methyltransferase Ste14